MFDKFRGVLEVIEYLDPTGQEIVHRVPEEGSGEIRMGSQCVVRENQAAIFFRDGRALDMLGPGRHTLTTLNIPLLTNYLKIPFGSKSPFRSEVVFVNLKDYVDLPWKAPKSIPYRDAEFGMVRLETEGKFAFQVGRPQLFVNQVVGTQGLFNTRDILHYMQSILVSRLSDLVGELKISILDLAAMYDELGAALRAKAAEDFEALGLLIKAVYITSINVPPEVEKAIDERASMGAIGDMNTYMQFKAARALGDAAKAGGEGGSFAGMGIGMGAGMGLGSAMASAIGQSFQGGGQAQQTQPQVAGSEDLPDGFAQLKQLVRQQLTLSDSDKQAAVVALDELLKQLLSDSSTIDDVKQARSTLISQFPWLTQPLKSLLSTPAALQVLGQITARSF
ncbi:MAG: SPFH domain-containing protein [Anaerolineae bacterium]|nr:SPFH domain-containing protein [Anaerolineae bacterium]